MTLDFNFGFWTFDVRLWSSKIQRPNVQHPNMIFQFFGRLHLVLLHLPIGILGLAIFLEIFSRQKKLASWRPAIHFVLGIGAGAAVLTAYFGWLLAGQGGYETEILGWHKWFGFAAAAAAVAAWLAREKAFYFPILIFCGVILAATGHFGGSLTHGENYLIEPFLEEKNETAAVTNFARPTDEVAVYQALIQPILEKKCATCHNPNKKKGQLLLDSPEGILKGGEHGKIVVPGKPDDSEMFRRANLPMADEKHMPPSGKIQLAPEELVFLKWWILEGADFSKKIGQMKVPPEVEAIFEKAKNAANLNPVFSKKIEAASAKDLAAVRAAGGSVLSFGNGSNWLSISYAGRKDLTGENIEPLEKVKTQVVQLDFGNSKLPATTFKLIKYLPNLTKLNLAGTSTGDADLQNLVDLKFLENINLTSTAVSAAGLEKLFGLPELKILHVWKTNLTEDEAKIFQKKYPRITLNFGEKTLLDSREIQLRPPKILAGRMIFDDTLQVTLDFPFKNVDIHFALDEASPTTESPKFDGKFLIFEKTTRIRAFASRAGWQNSPIVEATFAKKKISPKKITLLHPPSPKYPAQGAASLNDGRIGESHTDPTFLGFEGEHLDAVIDFGEHIDLQRFGFRYLENSYSAWIFPPAGLVVWTSDDLKNWKPAISKKYPIVKTMQVVKTGVISEALPVGTAARYLKIRVENLLKNPPWHPAPGQKCWLFVDEFLVE